MNEVLHTLPSGHADALRRELDENEQLLWAAVPVAWRAALFEIVVFVLASGFFALLAIPFASSTMDMWREWSGMLNAMPAASPKPTFWGVTLFIGTALGFGAASVASLVAAIVHHGRARRAVYALTDTRIIVLSFDPDGRTRCRSLEPRHPLSIQRTEHRDGSGTVLVHPSLNGEARSAGIALVGVPMPREVDRLIRKTFDPK